MTKMHGVEKIAVLLGGRSAEREVSLMSGKCVLNALRAIDFNAHAFDTAERDLAELKLEGFTRCFIALHGRGGEDGTVQGALELLDLPYTGSGPLASSLAMDKVMTKRVWSAEALRTPGWREVESTADTEAALLALGTPMIVKPVREGSTLGLTKVEKTTDCAAAYAKARDHDKRVMCEQFISGQEVTCAILGTGDAAQALPLIRIEAPAGDYNYKNKYFNHETQYLIPANLPQGEESAIQDMALRAYKTLGCRGWARIDIMIDARTRAPWLLEINTSPGMTDHSLFPMAAQAIGLDFPTLCVALLKDATLDSVHSERAALQ